MKTVKKVLFIVIVVFITVNVFKMLKEDHSITYKIDKYTVKENFYVSKGHYYDIVIKDKKNTFVYTLNKKLNKDKKIIKDIKTYKSNNLTCIIPIYKKKVTNDMYCRLDNQQVTVDYLNKTGNEDFKKINNKKLKISIPKEDNTKKKYKNITYYNKNVLEDQVFFLWNYKGIYILNNQGIKYKKFIDYDIYDNVMNCVVDKYYVLFENNSVNGIENVYYYDIKKDKLKKFKLKTKLSKNSYINGVVDNLIYVTDRRLKKEYTINIKKKTITSIDDDQTTYITYNNGEKEEMTKSDFFMNDILFDDNISDTKVTISSRLKKEYNYYYFIENDGIYKALDSNKKDRILLGKLNNISDWFVKEREVIILSQDTIYSYSDQYGLRIILSTNELKYNYRNIYNMWKK